ncbi:hypothetical protein Tamer19_06830 [Cupriavidus sp. TA19]|uniref:hypothetical protein n=1 Tax=unclassified Cupriavidus TaxID=2640874 RepID=UPI000E2E525C|nr:MULTISPECIES: hypothetical protein [unclassified Cupriavidus]BDB29448.1 hypothetical protein CTP10_R68620 [Cupriavidus sp. P-10]GLC91275.1 hypothetical protein Tamer19_06830 [Cupriavidus sp. TA19]
MSTERTDVIQQDAEGSTESAPTAVRMATTHTAVLIPSFRKGTFLKSGRIDSTKALLGERHLILSYEGYACSETMRLGTERPFYEVAFRGQVYRLLERPAAGHGNGFVHREHELVRTRAPGLRCDGEFDAPPATAPNTPRALVEDLQEVLKVDLAEILSHAYSIFHFRLDHKAEYPTTLEPEGYTLRQLFLMSTDAEGNLHTLYETPAGTNVELWTFFLRALDARNPKLVDYVNSSMAAKEFGEAGTLAMHEALRLRYGNSRSVIPTQGKRFIELFPPSKFSTKVTREVGANSGLM